MDVSDALKTRISNRAFLDKPVPAEDLRAILETARWSPSGGNLQPWRVYVVTGAARARVVEAAKAMMLDSPNPFNAPSEIAIYPPKLAEPWRTRRFELGEAMYELLGIGRDNKDGRLKQFLHNYEFFGAPVGLFFALDRRFDKGQWAHLGMFMQSIALVAVERGLATCMQEAWAPCATLVAEMLNIPDSEQVYCGMALGYPDTDAVVNKLRSTRADVDEFATFFDA